MMLPIILLTLVQALNVCGLTPEEWRGQSVYQVLTDRFARTDGSTTSPCDVSQGKYCGGSYQGIINHLDYIQGMGFTAVSDLQRRKPERS